jgi:hypothetical protein
MEIPPMTDPQGDPTRVQALKANVAARPAGDTDPDPCVNICTCAYCLRHLHPVHGLAALSSVQLAALERIEQWKQVPATTSPGRELDRMKTCLSDVEALLRGEGK